MTDTKTAEDVLHAIAGLLIEFRDQRQPDIATPAARTEVSAAEPEHAVDPRPDASAPWAEYMDEDPTKKRSTSLHMSPTLYAKMQWATHNVPKLSLQKLIQAGAEAEADRLIALYHKPN